MNYKAVAEIITKERYEIGIDKNCWSHHRFRRGYIDNPVAIRISGAGERILCENTA